MAGRPERAVQSGDKSPHSKIAGRSRGVATGANATSKLT